MVGSSAPTSTPRWPSRHCTASGECLRLSRRSPHAWRCAPHRELRGARGRGIEREPGQPERHPRGRCPPPQREPPSWGLAGHLPRADAAPDLGDRGADDRPQRERHRDRRVAVVPPRRDAAWHHEQDGATTRAAVTPADDHDGGRGRVGLRRATELALADAMAVQTETNPGRAARGVTDATRAGPGVRRRWRDRKPGLDAERVMDDV